MIQKNDSYGNEFLYSEDLLKDGEFKSPVCKIREVFPPGSLKSSDGRAIPKWTISFEGSDKKLVLCKTNVSIIHFVTGSEPSDAWIGKSITLQVRIIKAFGSDTTAIRIIPPVGVTLRKKLIDGLGVKAEFNG